MRRRRTAESHGYEQSARSCCLCTDSRTAVDPKRGAPRMPRRGPPTGITRDPCRKQPRSTSRTLTPAPGSKHPAEPRAGHEHPGQRERTGDAERRHGERLDLGGNAYRSQRDHQPDEHDALKHECAVGAARHGATARARGAIEASLREAEQPHRRADGERTLDRRQGQRCPVEPEVEEDASATPWRPSSRPERRTPRRRPARQSRIRGESGRARDSARLAGRRRSPNRTSPRTAATATGAIGRSGRWRLERRDAPQRWPPRSRRRARRASDRTAGRCDPRRRRRPRRRPGAGASAARPRRRASR